MVIFVESSKHIKTIELLQSLQAKSLIIIHKSRGEVSLARAEICQRFGWPFGRFGETKNHSEIN